MIHIFVGTKAQFIKMAPIMLELDRRGMIYNLIDAGQHAEVTGQIARQFGLRRADVSLRPGERNITTPLEAIVWIGKGLFQIAFKREHLYQRLFRRQAGICLIHGDTLTTVLSLLCAKRCGLRVAHVEAGLRSYSLLNPFPEEIIRLIAMRYSDLLFAPSESAAENLHRMGYGSKTVNSGGNTVAEAVQIALQNKTGQGEPRRRYAVVTIHRVENIYSRSRLSEIVALLERIGRDRRVLFVLHEPTRHQLLRFNLLARLLQNEAIEVIPLQPYFEFLHLLVAADFIVTDGGSIQEESYFLNIPCLIMRARTERSEGLGENTFLAAFDQRRIDQFLHNFSSFRRTNANPPLNPSRTIVDHLLATL
jgi:UDP-N-acetylglucosamine 2-epimerase